MRVPFSDESQEPHEKEDKFITSSYDDRFEPREVYCAFLDILGFKQVFLEGLKDTTTGWKKGLAIQNYSAIMSQIDMSTKAHEGILKVNRSTTSMNWFSVSDSIIITCDNLAWLVLVCSNVQNILLENNLLVRGAISFGRHWQSAHERSYHLLSDAYVKAMELEKKAVNPKVILDPLMPVQGDYGLTQLRTIHQGKTIFYAENDDVWFINPFFEEYLNPKKGDLEHICYIISGGQKASPAEARNKWVWFAGLLKQWVFDSTGTDSEIIKIYDNLQIVFNANFSASSRG